MINDANLLLAGTVSSAGVVTGQLVTALGNTVSTNTVDLANATFANQTTEFGQGRRLQINVSVLQAVTSAGAATVQLQLIQATDAALTTAVDVINQTDVFAIANLTAGTVVPVTWDRIAPLVPKRYIGLRFVVGTAALTNATGQFVGTVVLDQQDVKNIFPRAGYLVN